jgi:putative phosphoribosyl transferase
MDRRHAGRALAAELAHLVGERPVVVGLPRGGVPVAFEVARALDAPLDVIVVRKVGVPFQPEVGVGAVGKDGVRVLDTEMIRRLGIAPAEIAAVEDRERAEVERRAARLRASTPRVPLEGRTVIVVDDGIATGGTARAAIEVARAHGAARVVIAAPVASPDTVADLSTMADAVVCPLQPSRFGAVGAFYDDFSPVTEDEVVTLLASSRTLDGQVRIPIDGLELEGELSVPTAARGVVVFAHGSGSSRHSPRNRFVAKVLNHAGLATLLLDLLTLEEAHDRGNVFDIDLLTQRLVAAVDWVSESPRTVGLPVGLFGASTGAAGALCAAAAMPGRVEAVVSRGGRPDLAGDALGQVRAPTLLIVGRRDEAVLDLNEQARARMRCEQRLVVVPGATHLFDEPGTLEVAADLASTWFLRHLAGEAELSSGASASR